MFFLVHLMMFVAEDNKSEEVQTAKVIKSDEGQVVEFLLEKNFGFGVSYLREHEFLGGGTEEDNTYSLEFSNIEGISDKNSEFGAVVNEEGEINTYYIVVDYTEETLNNIFEIFGNEFKCRNKNPLNPDDLPGKIDYESNFGNDSYVSIVCSEDKIKASVQYGWVRYACAESVIPVDRRRETCFYSDDPVMGIDKEGMKSQIKIPLLSENEGGFNCEYDGIDGLYEGITRVYYIFKDNALGGVVAYIPFSQELFDKTVEYYGAKKSDNDESRYVSVTGNRNVDITVSDNNICIVFFEN